MAVIINEAEDQHFSAPSGMDMCGNFDWTIEEFYQALNATPQESKEDDDDIDMLALGFRCGTGKQFVAVIDGKCHPSHTLPVLLLY